MMETATVMTAKELKAQIQYRGAVATFARLQAKAKVKEIIRSEGRKVHHFTARELAILAEDYLAKHPELVAKAKAWAQEFLTKRR